MSIEEIKKKLDSDDNTATLLPIQLTEMEAKMKLLKFYSAAYEAGLINLKSYERLLYAI